MSPFERLLLILGILVIIALIYGTLYSKDLLKKNPFLDKHLLERGMNKPVIWLYYDNSDVNSRSWADFGARGSRALHIPFLNMCYKSIVKHNHELYRIEVIGGLAGAAERLGGWEQLPPGLRDPIRPVNDEEMNYLRAAILAKYGGLWLSPYSICLKPFGPLPKEKSVFFGMDLDESYSGPNGTTLPGFRAIWSPKAHHPMFEEWMAVAYKRVAEKRGGGQIRKDEKWDFVRFSEAYVETGIVVDPHAELSRKQDGKRIQLEDLLASGATPFNVPPHSVYVPFPWTELRDREAFGWFLRMSEEQIMESDLAATHLLRM